MRRRGLYVVACRLNGLFKIGISWHPTGRIADLSNFSPVPLELVRVCYPTDAIATERHLHETYRDKRHHGEWFELSPGDLADIARLFPGESPPAETAVGAVLDEARMLARRSGRAVDVLRSASTPESYRIVDGHTTPDGYMPLYTVTRCGGAHRRGKRLEKNTGS